MSTITKAESLTPFASGQIANIDAAQNLPAASFADTTAQQDAVMVLVSPNTQAARFDFNGGTPTASVGIPIAVSEKYEIWGHDVIVKCKLIGQVAGGKLDWVAFR